MELFVTIAKKRLKVALNKIQTTITKTIMSMWILRTKGNC